MRQKKAHIMSNTINTQKLSEMVKSKRNNKGLREAATEIGGISASTLSRIEQGKLPDVETFLKLCDWLEVSAENFTKSQTKTDLKSEKQIIAHLRADKNLKPETATSLIRMIELAYKVDRKNR